MRLNLTQRGTAYQARRPDERARDGPASGAWPLPTRGAILWLSPSISEIPGTGAKAHEGGDKDRSVMPLDGLGCTRTTVAALTNESEKRGREGMGLGRGAGTRNCQ